MQDILTFAIYLAAGCGAGLLAGLFGIGGGLLMVPVLLFTLSATVPAGVVGPMALGTSLTVIIVTSALASRQQFVLGRLREPFGRATLMLVACIAAGVLLGSQVSTRMAHAPLMACIAIFQVAVAAWMFCRSFDLGTKRPDDAVPAQDRLGGRASRLFLLLTGTVSAIGGISGATLMVPYMRWKGITQSEATALATHLGCVIGMSGFISYGLLSKPALPVPWSIGYVSLPAFVAMALGSAALVRFGARLSSRLDPRLLTRCFSALLLITALKLLSSLAHQACG